MDIKSLYDTEKTFSLGLVRPDTDEPIGITFEIRSSSSDEVKKILRKHVDEILERQQRGKLVKADAAIRRELEKAAACVAGWDWGEHTYGGEKLDASFKNVLRVLDEQDWIFAQVKEASDKLANFTTESQKKPAKP